MTQTDNGSRRPFLWLPASLMFLGALCALTHAKADSPLAAPAPVPVAVRVFDGDRFVSDLTLSDFEVDEAGMRVMPWALFLVRKDRVERREGRPDPAPDLSRSLVLSFQMTDYHSKIPEALEFLFTKELLPTDTLEIETPMRVYRLSSSALRAKPRPILARELTEIVRKDIIEGGMAYNTAVRDLKRIVRQIGGTGRTGLGDTEGEIDEGGSLEQQLMLYGDHLQQMEVLRAVDEAKLTGFAGRMKGQPGQKLAFFVYQREFRPEISPQTLDRLVMGNQDRPDILASLESLFAMYKRPVNMNRTSIMQAFADSGMDFNFLYVNRPPERVSGINMREQSEDVFKALSGAAEATGGLTDTFQNPATSLAKALRTTEQFYVLLFDSSTAAPPGTFIDLAVRVKGKDFRVVHRSGYLSGP
jgi:hypothetical protein